jgi:hypothetical protein
MSGSSRCPERRFIIHLSVINQMETNHPAKLAGSTVGGTFKSTARWLSGRRAVAERTFGG